MTIAALAQTRAQIAGDGVTDRVDVTFQFVDESDLNVIHTDSGGTDTEWVFQESPGGWYYTGGDYAAGTIHFTASDLAVGERLTVLLTSQYDQTLSLDGGEIDPSVLERGMDRAALQIQSIAGEVGRALRVSPSLSGAMPDLEVPDLPDGHTFVRDGDELIPALIDSAAISTAVAAAQSAFASAETAQGEAVSARDAAVSAASGASSSETNAGSSAVSAADSATAAATSASSATQSAEDARTNATEVLEYGRIPVGAMMSWASPKAPNQFWLLITEPGQVYNRSTFPALHDVLAPSLQLDMETSTTLGVSTDTAWNQIPVGASVEGVGIPAGTTVANVGYESSLKSYVVTLSQAASTATSEIRVFQHGNGDGSTTSNFPDTAGRVHRAIDLSDTVNSSGSRLGETEEDAFQGHWHRYESNSSPQSGSTTQVENNNDNLPHHNQYFTKVQDAISDGLNGEPRTADETRVKSWIGPYIIKVADGVDSEELLNALQVVQDSSTALSKAIANETLIAELQAGETHDLAGLSEVVIDLSKYSAVKEFELALWGNNSNNNVLVCYQVSEDGGASWISSGYYSGFGAEGHGAATAKYDNTTFGYVVLGTINSFEEGYHVNPVRIDTLNGFYAKGTGRYWSGSGANYGMTLYSFVRDTAVTVNALRIYPASGTFAAGGLVLRSIR